MMVGFSLQNFRAFKSERIELRPLTVIIGANGLGKSTLFHPLLLMKQTLERADTLQHDDLLVNGNLVSFGHAINLFHNWDATQPISLSFDLLVPELPKTIDDIDRRLRSLARSFLVRVWRDSRIVENMHERRRQRTPTEMKLTAQFISQMRPYVAGSLPPLNTTIELLAIAERVIDAGRVDPRAIAEEMNIVFRAKESKDQRARMLLGLKMLLDLAEKRELFADNVLTLRFDALPRNKSANTELYISSLSVRVKGLSLFELALDELGRVLSITSSIFSEPNPFSPAALKKMAVKSDTEPVLRSLSLGLTADYPAEIIETCFATTLAKFNNQLSSHMMRHVASLRFHPARFYDKSNFDRVNRNAVRVIGVLANDKKLLSKVNNWALHHLGVEFATQEWEGALHKVDIGMPHLSKPLSLADTGFGYSQIIPILVELVSLAAGGIAIIEQPEAHLHPSLQYEIADWIFEAAGEGRRIIIETHSDHILRRLHRRVLETSQHPSSLMGLYYVESGKDQFPTVRRIELDGRGDFEWPIGFSADANDDTLAILRGLNR